MLLGVAAHCSVDRRRVMRQLLAAWRERARWSHPGIVRVAGRTAQVVRAIVHGETGGGVVGGWRRRGRSGALPRREVRATFSPEVEGGF